MSRLRSFWQNTQAVAAVEMVLIMPLAVLLIVSAMEAGHYLYTEHQVIKGVRDASRFAARLPFATYGCTAVSGEADLPDTNPAWQTVANVAVYGNVSGTGQPRIATWTATTADVTIRVACYDVEGGGIYSAEGVAPQIAVIGRPAYPSLFRALAGFPVTLRLYARQQALGVGL